jgi:hypothetical protein
LKANSVANIKAYLGANGMKDMLAVLGLDNDTLHDFIGSKSDATVGASKAIATPTIGAGLLPPAPVVAAPVAPKAVP